MSISFECRQCGKKLKAPDGAAGKKSPCPGCGVEVTCPSSNGKAAAVSVAASRPPDLDPYDDVGPGDPYGLTDPPPEPLPAVAVESGPSVGKPKKKAAKGKRAELRSIAVCQKGVLFCILIQIGLIITSVVAPPQYKQSAAIANFVVGLVALVFIFKLAVRLYGTGKGVFLSILSIVPCLSLIIMLVMNSKATRTLRDNGLQVGFMGADLSQF